MFLTVILVGIVHGALGTFPPVSNPPPIPSQAVRTLDISSQQFYVQEDLSQNPPQPNVRDGPYSQDEQRWYFQESQPGDSAENQGSSEDFDRFFRNGEPAIGPVATPIPDNAYDAQASIVSNLNPDDATNTGTSDIWILTRGSDNQNTLERWLPIQVPNQRVVEVINPDTSPSLATDIVKSVAAPVPDSSVKRQYVPVPQGNLVQQVVIQSRDIASSQNVFPNSASVIEKVPSVKQIIDVPQGNIKQVVQQQVIKDSYPISSSFNSPTSPVVSKPFSVPPPPPPPIKGGATSKTVSSFPVNPQQPSNVLISDKNGLLQPLRHIWIPTSSRTGRFISIPATSVNPGKSVLNLGSPLNATPITVSDTWILNQDGPIPSFEQQKSVASLPVVQSGKVVFQDSPTVQVDPPAIAQVVSQVDSSKNPSIVKSINSPLNIWPNRNINQNVYSKPGAVATPSFPLPSPNSGAVLLSKSIPPPAPQKTLIANSKSLLPPPQPLQPAGPIIKGKPCPIPPQKLSLAPPTPTLLNAPIPKIVATQNRLPLQRIMRINRFPTGSYYLLNTRFRPNVFTYPAPVAIQQPKTGFIRLLQAGVPFPFQSKQISLPVQTKQISIPVKPKLIQSPIPGKLVAYTLPTPQIIAPSSPKTPSQILYPAIQSIRYPWSGYLKSNPIPGAGFVVPQTGSLKVLPIISSSSQSSSSEDSSREKKEEKPKTGEKPKTEAKPKTEEKPSKEEVNSSEEKEPEKEPETESTELEKEDEGATSESKSEESIDVAESQVAHQALENIATIVAKPYLFRFDNGDKNDTFQYRQKVSDVVEMATGTYGYQDPNGVFRISKYITDDDEYGIKNIDPETATHENARVNYISNQYSDVEKAKTETEISTRDSYYYAA